MSEISNNKHSIEILVEQAKDGDKAALETVIEHCQHRVYNLALRMLWHPADAEDATQEILIKVITHLAQFRGESRFDTWVYGIASNHLLTTRKRRAELHQITFEMVADELENRMDVEVAVPADSVEHHLLLEEVQYRCTLGMLLCLDREHRLAYILGEIIGVDSREGAEILEISEVNYRKRLSRARASVRGFMQSNCGIVNPNNPCRCERQLGYKVQYEKLAKNQLLFADKPIISDDVKKRIVEMQEIDRTIALYRSQPEFAAPQQLTQAIKQLLISGRFEWFS